VVARDQRETTVNIGYREIAFEDSLSLHQHSELFFVDGFEAQ
jgi:hypothetical protein